MKLADGSLVDPAGGLEHASPKGGIFVPRAFLDSILEAATLYGMSFLFRNDGTGGGYLLEFVSEAFASGLSHVRSILLEESIHISSASTHEGKDVQEDGQESAYEEITGALSILIQSVRSLASGLALPEVGINLNSLLAVDQAMNLTESMVRRRVDQKFTTCVSMCSGLFDSLCTRVVEERSSTESDEKPGLPQLVQIASMTLSDCLQLVDDTVRSVFSGGVVLGGDTSAPADQPILREAVEASTRRFASWLADSLEILAGGESSDPKDVMDASLGIEDEEGSSDEDLGAGEMDARASVQDDTSDLAGQDDTRIRNLVDRALKVLVTGDDKIGANAVHSDFILAIAEMCRLAERSVAENLDQSIATHLGGGKKKSRSLFPSGVSSPRIKGSDRDNEISKRFLLAASRVLVLYATNRGSMAAEILCADLDGLISLERPRPATLEVLSIAKIVAVECGEIFGGKKRAGPVPVMEVDQLSGFASPLGRKTGLQLDVERMFKENVTIYPHISETMDFSRNAVLFLMFKVAFRALLEHTRMGTFSKDGYCQLQVDAEFLKHMVPHYISGDFMVNGSNASSLLSNLMGDVTTNAGLRCTDESCAEDDDLLYDSRATVRAFLANVPPAVADKYVIKED
jgi:hypothetical protein